MGILAEMHEQEMERMREQARATEAQARLASARADEQKAIRARIEAETARANVDAGRAADTDTWQRPRVVATECRGRSLCRRADCSPACDADV